jgi:hypothetical protein
LKIEKKKKKKKKKKKGTKNFFFVKKIEFCLLQSLLLGAAGLEPGVAQRVAHPARGPAVGRDHRDCDGRAVPLCSECDHGGNSHANYQCAQIVKHRARPRGRRLGGCRDIAAGRDEKWEKEMDIFI